MYESMYLKIYATNLFLPSRRNSSQRDIRDITQLVGALLERKISCNWSQAGYRLEKVLNLQFSMVGQSFTSMANNFTNLLNLEIRQLPVLLNKKKVMLILVVFI